MLLTKSGVALGLIATLMLSIVVSMWMLDVDLRRLAERSTLCLSAEGRFRFNGVSGSESEVVSSVMALTACLKKLMTLPHILWTPDETCSDEDEENEDDFIFVMSPLFMN